MKYNILGKTLLKVSQIGFGGIPIMSGRNSEFLVELSNVSYDEAINTLQCAYDNGINFFDTAKDYRDSEMKIGNAFVGLRKKVYLASKSKAITYDDMMKDIETSLNNLNTDYIDLYQLHYVRDVENYNKIMSLENGAIKALVECKKAGKIRYIGIASHNVYVLTPAIQSNFFDTVQLPLNLIETDCLDITNQCRKLNIGIIIMKPFAGGTLTKVSDNIRKYNIDDDKLREIALHYILQQKVDTVIPGMSSPEEVVNNIKILKTYSERENDNKDIALKISKELGTSFCRRCQYCEPCPNHIPIENIIRLKKYFLDYSLHSWAIEQYSKLKYNYLDCKKCYKCESKCPYNLKIVSQLEDIHKLLWKVDVK